MSIKNLFLILSITGMFTAQAFAQTGGAEYRKHAEETLKVRDWGPSKKQITYSEIPYAATRNAIKKGDKGYVVAGMLSLGTIPLMVVAMETIVLTIATPIFGGVKLKKYIKSLPYFEMAAILDFATGTNPSLENETAFNEFYAKMAEGTALTPTALCNLLKEKVKNNDFVGFPTSSELIANRKNILEDADMG